MGSVVHSNLGLFAGSSDEPKSGSLNSYTGQLSTTSELPHRSRSSLDRPHTRATLILYPDGDAQITGSHYFPTVGKRKEPETEEEKRRRAAGRASAKVHAMAKFHGLDRLWTITARGGIKTFAEAVSVIARFKRQLLKKYPDCKAVFVPELHTGGGLNDGTWHVHFAVCGFLDVNLLRPMVYRIFGFNAEGQPNGQINVSTKQSQLDSPASVASYICAYITKNVFAAHREKNQRYYFITRATALPNLRRPENQAQSFGVLTVGRDYRGRIAERESRLRGLIFVKTGRFARTVWKSEDGLNFRMATFGRGQHNETG